MELKIEDLRPGTYYYVVQTGADGTRWIMLISDIEAGGRILTNEYTYCDNLGHRRNSSNQIRCGWGDKSNIKRVRAATPSEILWHKRCLEGETRESIPLENQEFIINTYSLF